MTDRLHRACAEALRSWSAPDGEQAALRQDFLAHLDRHPNGWSRTCEAAHLTASALVCAPGRGEVLLTHHRRIGRWLQTGGHLEPTDASLAAAALREAAEETGLGDLELDPDPLRLDAHVVACRPAGSSRHLDVQYLARSAAGGAPTWGPESVDVRWFGAHALPPSDPSVTALVAAAARRLRWARPPTNSG